MPEHHDDPEGAIRAACERGDHDAAATLALERYGRELLAFLIARSPSYDEASDIFGQLSEDLWKGLPGFQWRSSLRTWLYKLARHAAYRHRKQAARRVSAVPLSGVSQLSAVVQRLRTETRAHLRTQNKTRLQELREQLPAEDQTVLILRVDRGMAWRELAEIMLPADVEPTAALLERESARLRKRFQAAKDKLKALAVAEGLIGGDEAG